MSHMVFMGGLWYALSIISERIASEKRTLCILGCYVISGFQEFSFKIWVCFPCYWI